MHALDNIIDSFSRLPGIGKKSANRIAYYLLAQPEFEAEQLAQAILALHKNIRNCPVCGALTDNEHSELCEICADPNRDTSIICVVERAQDVATLARINEYQGMFHVLGGVIAPLNGIGPENLHISSLIARIQKNTVQEIILATNPTIEGDTTALYLQKLLSEYNIEITRLASGLPAGGDLEYADQLTLLRSLRGRGKF